MPINTGNAGRVVLARFEFTGIIRRLAHGTDPLFRAIAKESVHLVDANAVVETRPRCAIVLVYLALQT